MCFEIQYTRQSIDKSSRLKKTVNDRLEYIQITDPILQQGIKDLDDLLESLLTIAENYDKIGDTEWGVRLMRCRYVLGVD